MTHDSATRIACACGWRGPLGDAIVGGDDQLYCPNCATHGQLMREEVLDRILRKMKKRSPDAVTAALDAHFGDSLAWRLSQRSN